MLRVKGQTSTEYMLIISVVVIAVVGAASVFVPQFRDGVTTLGGRVREALSSGSLGVVGGGGPTVDPGRVSPNVGTQPDPRSVPTPGRSIGDAT